MNMRIKLHRALLLIMLLIALGPSNTPAALAANTQVLFSQVQVRKTSASDHLSRLHEAIIIKNDSEDDVDITNWCVYYASVAIDFTDGTKRKIGCFAPKNPNEKIFLKALGVVRFGSFDSDFFDPSIFFAPSFSQGLGNEKGKLILINGSEEVDRVEWGVHPNSFKIGSGAVFGRKSNESGVLVYSGVSKEDFELIESVDTTSGLGVYVKTDFCPDVEGFQYDDEECIKPVPPVNTEQDLPFSNISSQDHTIQLVEFFPNPAGVDAGKEFIELYNYGLKNLSLSNYTLTIESGASRKTYPLPDLIFHPGEYLAIYNTGLQNFSLNNTAGKISILHNNQLVDQASYLSTKEGYSWSLLGDKFSLSIPSPNTENTIEDTIILEKNGKVIELKPCAADQERNPVTGRCRKIAVAKVVAPCKPGQERNPATGRCRNIPKPKALTPCKPGQERNPATGRCRNIKRKSPPSTVDGLKAIKVPEVNTLWIWVGGVAILTGVFIYTGWEWRHEIKNTINKFKAKK